jgi:hypothetical protein
MGIGKRVAIGLGVGGAAGLAAGVAGGLYAGHLDPRALALFVGGGLAVGLVAAVLSALGFDARDFR